MTLDLLVSVFPGSMLVFKNTKQSQRQADNTTNAYTNYFLMLSCVLLETLKGLWHT